VNGTGTTDAAFLLHRQLALAVNTEELGIPLNKGGATMAHALLKVLLSRQTHRNLLSLVMHLLTRFVKGL
jgi:hypothetical protein